MDIFNHFGKKERRYIDSIGNFDIIASEYVKKEQMANYHHEGKNQTNSAEVSTWEIIK